MTRAGRRGASILVALAGLALLLFNFPLLLIWDQGRELFGLPMLPVVLFLIWTGLILALAWFSETGLRAPRDSPLDPRWTPEDGPDDSDGAS